MIRTNNAKQKEKQQKTGYLSHEPDLPVQSKGVVELYVGVSHGVKGRELLQSLHQLHDGLVILDDKTRTRSLGGERTPGRQPPPSPSIPQLPQRMFVLSVHIVTIPKER